MEAAQGLAEMARVPGPQFQHAGPSVSGTGSGATTCAPGGLAGVVQSGSCPSTQDCIEVAQAPGAPIPAHRVVQGQYSSDPGKWAWSSLWTHPVPLIWTTGPKGWAPLM